MLTTCSACSSGLASVAMGATLLRANEVDVVIAGGYDPISEYSYAGFESLRLIAADAPRPFASDRDGMRVAEGYGVLILERGVDAAARGAKALACIGGFGESADAFHLTQPHPQGVGAAAAMRVALHAAGVSPQDIDLVCAHGTATINNDAAEYAALASIFGDHLPRVAITALKSHLGHTLGGAGAVELVLAVMARLDGEIPATAGVVEVDPAFKGLNLVRGSAIARHVRTTINLSLGFGGANTCIVLTEPMPRRLEPSSSQAPPSRSTPLNEVVITGVGVVLPGAIGNEAFVRLLAAPGQPPLADTGSISEEQYAHLLNARRVRRMSDYVKLTLASAVEACRSAGVHEDSGFLGSSAAILATMHGSSSYCESFYSQVVRDGMGRGSGDGGANPVLFAEGVPNAAAAQLSLMLGLHGGCQTVIGTRNALVDAMHVAALRIQHGVCARAFVGAAEEYLPLANRACAASGLYGPGTDGFATGSGAVSFILESAVSASARGAPALAEYLQGGWSSLGMQSAQDVYQQLNSPECITGPWSRVAADVRACIDVGRARTDSAGSSPAGLWSSGERFAELFSVGAGVGLAAALLLDDLPCCSPSGRTDAGPVSKGAFRLGVMSTEFSGDCSGVVWRIPRASGRQR